jgi:hypothetical protein
VKPCKSSISVSRGESVQNLRAFEHLIDDEDA